MKKILSLLLAVMLIAASTASSLAEGGAPIYDIEMYGYASADFVSTEDGNGYYQPLTWQSFGTADLGDVTDLGGMIDADGNETYVGCAEYINGRVYGYTGFGAYPEAYFSIDFDELASGNLSAVEYTGYTDDVNMHLDMAYDRDTGVLYVLTLDINYQLKLCSVDIASGEKTEIGIPFIEYEDYSADIIYSIAAAHGTLYCLLPAAGAAMNGGSAQLCTIDLETCELSFVGSTGVLSFQQQSITYDYDNEIIVWSQYEFQYGGYSLLRAINPSTGETTTIGTVGSNNGIAYLGLMIPGENNEPVPPTDEPITDAPVTDEPITDAPITDAPITDEPITDAPITDAPVTTDVPVEPTDAPNPPATGAITLIGVGIAAIVGGAGIALFRRKED